MTLTPVSGEAPNRFALIGVTLRWANLFEPYHSPANYRATNEDGSPGRMQGRYGVTFHQSALPDWVGVRIKSNREDGMVMATTRFVPPIIPDDPVMMRRVMADAEMCRVPLDRLLQGQKVDLAGNVFEYRAPPRHDATALRPSSPYGMGLFVVRINAAELNGAFERYMDEAFESVESSENA